jgi:hypothetical protein
MRGYNTGYETCSAGGGGGGGSSRSGSTYATGFRDGKAQGERDALSGRSFDDRCGGPTNEYCIDGGHTFNDLIRLSANGTIGSG